jgi:type I restriction-modification system specificity determinant
MERYSEYKDSGAQWLGKIPKHWDVIKAKYLWNEVFSFSENGSENLLSVSQYDGVTQAKNESRSESLKGYKKVAKDNLVINIMLAWMGGLGVSEYNGIVSPAYCVYRLKKAANPKFMHYLYKTPMYLAEFARHSTGVIPSRWRMYTDDFGQVLTLIPPIDEQDKIVSYLYKVTSKIDEAIAQQQKMIDLLNERKQIIINNAVTKGLNPDVPMKYSGVDWIGEIPEHWQSIKLKYLCSMKSGENLTSNQIEEYGKYKVFGGNGIRGYFSKYNCKGPILLIGRQGALCGNVHHAEEKIWATDHAIVTQNNVNINIKFLFYLLKCMNLNQYGIQTAAQPGLSVSTIKNIYGLLPSIDEQSEIVKYLNAKLVEINNTIAYNRGMVSLLQERKQIIINDVVTGKVKVS